MNALTLMTHGYLGDEPQRPPEPPVIVGVKPNPPPAPPVIVARPKGR
jgi:hypothetical protein